VPGISEAPARRVSRDAEAPKAIESTPGEFAFDPAKSAANLEKHGIDFVTAQQLWGAPALLEIPARTRGEARFVIIAQLRNKHWSAVITTRGTSIRLISVRRSRRKEILLDEQL
jgi:uncharacterized DUF497 family protein